MAEIAKDKSVDPADIEIWFGDEARIISVARKDRETRTFKAGSTYFEGARENHPPGQMSAKNAADGMTRVVIVELAPKE